jgi:NDP-sugar pyrophosphorylase family protein
MNKKTHPLKAVILVGGPGMRLRPLTEDRPKPMVPVLNHPFLEHTIAQLKKYDIRDIILAMSYLPEAIPAYFGGGECCGVRLTYCVEKEPLGTAGAVKNASPHLDGPMIVLNGDNVFIEMDWDEVFAYHREKNAKVTIFLTRVENPSAFGVVETDAQGRVLRFIEKPPPGTETTDWINAGGYILEPEVLDCVPADTYYMFEKGLFPDLLEKGEPVFGYHYSGYWLDVGTPSKYFSLNIDLLKSRVRSPLVTPGEADGTRYGENVSIHPAAKVTAPVIIEKGCRIEGDARLAGPVVLGRDCRVMAGAVVENSILWDNVTIGAKSRVTRCIVCSRAVIGDNTGVADSIVTADKTVPLQP